MAVETSKISLLELNRVLKEGIQSLFPSGIWVIAEISDMNTNQSGHCYLELVEKADGSESIVAKSRATIWSFTFRILRPYFESVTGQRFSSGIKVLLFVSVEFHELYGFSLNVKDIDPNYTIGDLARKKQEIIKRLTDEGVFELNKELLLPEIARNIAVISSETAAGYGDFIKQLKNNNRGFKFNVTLFNAYMQGDDTEQSVIRALEQIYDRYEKFDLVAIIRGGGSQSELNYFNNYNIAFHITQFPLPVFTGIGHDRDQTIADLVAHTSLKTPTAVAEYIISLMTESADYVFQLEEQLISLATNVISNHKNYFRELTLNFRNLYKWQLNTLNNSLNFMENNFNHKIKHIIPKRKSNLNQLQQQFQAKLKYNLLLHKLHHNRLQQALPVSALTFIKKQKSKFLVAEALITAYNPVNILKRGYSITYYNGKALYSPVVVKSGDLIETRLSEGCIKSRIE